MRRTFVPVAGAVAILVAACAEPTSIPRPGTPSLQRIAVIAHSAAEAGRYLVVASSHSIPTGFADRVASLGGAVDATYGQIGVAVVSGLSPENATALQGSEGIQYVELDDEVQWISNDVDVEAEDAGASEDSPMNHLPPSSAGFFPRQWGMRAVNAHLAWAAGRLGSPNIRVSILDSGIDYTHQSLVGLVNLALSRSFISSDQRLIDSVFAGQNLNPVVDLNRHGTHVASTVASTGHGTAGVTQKVQLVAVKVLAASGSGSSSGVLAGIIYAADIDSDVISMSLGSTFSKDSFPGRVAGIHRAMNYANRKGTVIIASSGNENMNLDSLHLANGFKTYCDGSVAICVGATAPRIAAPTVNGPWTDIDTRASYSNYGAAVDVAAPGGTGGNRFIWAACSSYSLITTACQASKSFALGISGTSMATPHVTGMAALIVEDVGKDRPGLVRQLIRRYVDDAGELGEDVQFGKGRINVAKAVGLQ